MEINNFKQATQKRLDELETELNSLKKEYNELLSKWEEEKNLIRTVQELQESFEQLKTEAENFERIGDFGKVAEIRYGKLPETEKKIAEINARIKSAPKSSKLLKDEVEPEDIADVVSRWTRIPVNKMLETERTKLLKMEERLNKRVISQDEAVHSISNALRRSRAGLQDENRPIGSFIFLGSTGVGKTEMARALAEFLFDDEQAIIRIDMSEYMEKFSVSRLIGAPPGYVGYEEGGQLTEAVRRKPYSVVLLDEIEKAHSDVFNLLLQLLDDGRLTDSKGRTVNFKNTIIIMTSNLGSEIISQVLTKINENNRTQIISDVKEKMLALLKQRMRPEFLNRIDDIILFNPLTENDIIKISELQIKILKHRLQKNNINLEISDEAMQWLAKIGFDPNFGARPLKRAVQKYLADPLAMKILSGDISNGNNVLVEVAQNGTFIFKVIN